MAKIWERLDKVASDVHTMKGNMAGNTALTQETLAGVDAITRGVRVPRSALHQATSDRGTIVITGGHSNALQRHTTCAELHHYKISTFPAKRLIDCHIEFMSESSFGLGGLSVREAFEDRPQRIERGGWLCEFDVTERELTKSEYRMLR